MVGICLLKASNQPPFIKFKGFGGKLLPQLFEAFSTTGTKESLTWLEIRILSTGRDA